MTKQNSHFFSIIIPTYNRAKLLKIAIDSVLAQSFSDFELIVVDDGSTDNTKGIINRYKDERVNYVYQTNQGPSSARNTGINISKGRFICFLDSDDRFRKDKLQVTYSYIKNHPNYKIFHTEEVWYRNSRYLPQKQIHSKPSGFVFLKAVEICCISLSTACLHKDVFDKIGLFDADFPVCEDYEFWLRATLKYKVKLIPEFLTIKEGGHIDQQSSKKGLDKYRFLALDKLLRSNPIPKKYILEITRNLKDKAGIYLAGAEKRAKTEEVSSIKEKLGQTIKKYET